MFRVGILFGLMSLGLVLVGCTSEEAKLEAEIINKESFLSAKRSCEDTQKFMRERFGSAPTTLQKCIEGVFNEFTTEICEKKGHPVIGTTCSNARKRVIAKVGEYVAELPK